MCLTDNGDTNESTIPTPWTVRLRCQARSVLYDINGNFVNDDQALLAYKGDLADYDKSGTLLVAKIVNNKLTWADSRWCSYPARHGLRHPRPRVGTSMTPASPISN